MAEVNVKLNGSPYFPENGSFIDIRNEDCANLEDKGASWKDVTSKAYRSITVGAEEEDDTSENDMLSATLPASQWWTSECGAWEVIFSENFNEETKRKVCWNLEISGGVKDPEGVAEANAKAGVESCSEWTEPAESVLWYMEVENY
jgi:hypothetical protein